MWRAIRIYFLYVLFFGLHMLLWVPALKAYACAAILLPQRERNKIKTFSLSHIWTRKSLLTIVNNLHIYIYIYLEEGMATHSSILAWRIPWTEEPGRLQSTGLQRVGHNWSDLAQHVCVCVCVYRQMQIFPSNSDVLTNLHFKLSFWSERSSLHSIQKYVHN